MKVQWGPRPKWWNFSFENVRITKMSDMYHMAEWQGTPGSMHPVICLTYAQAVGYRKLFLSHPDRPLKFMGKPIVVVGNPLPLPDPDTWWWFPEGRRPA
jgi:hypothetical protein